MNKKDIKQIVSIHHMLAMGEVVLLSVAFRIIKENYPDAKLTVIASKYACEFLKFIPWVDSVKSIDDFGIYMSKTSIFKREFNKFFIVRRLSSFLIKGGFDYVFVRGDKRLLYTALIQEAIDKSGIEDVVILKKLMDKHFDSSRNVVDSYISILKDVGFEANGDERPTLFVDEQARQNVLNFLGGKGVVKGEHKVIGLCLSSNLKVKNWSAKRNRELLEMFARDDNIRILQFSTDADFVTDDLDYVCDKLVHVGVLPFDELIALISQCDLFISVDTGKMHVAAAVGVPTIGIFGPTSEIMFGPRGDNCAVLEKRPDCSFFTPDSFFSSKRVGFQKCYLEDKCKLLQTTCVDEVTAAEVFELSGDMLRKAAG